MNQIEAYKQKVKSVIEKHGGRVDIGIIPGVIEQPKELKVSSEDKRLFYYNPVEIGFDGVNLSVVLDGRKLTVEKAQELLRRLLSANEILEEIGSEES